MFAKQFAAPAALGVMLAAQVRPVLAQISGSQGCWSSSGDLVMQGSAQWQTSLNCQQQCPSSAVIAVKQADCYCGDLLPPKGSKVDDSDCNISCFGFPAEMCGGSNAWNVYLTNPNVAVGNSGGDDSSSSSASSSDRPSPTAKPTTVETPTTVYVSGTVKTVVQPPKTSSAQPSDATQGSGVTTTQKDNDGGSNTGGIVAGVVVGVVALIAIILGTLWFLRKRKFRNDGHQRVQSTNAFATAGAGPGTMDTRLDPGMVQRRDSTGSVFADNQDYSRRILRVANPDNR